MDFRMCGFLPDSLVNGEGTRSVIFFSGCKHQCKNCHNEYFWPMESGMNVSIEEAIKMVDKQKEVIDGVTISGGDPFYQYDSLLELCKQLKEKGYNIWVYTGFRMEYVKSNTPDILNYIDALIDDVYIEELKDESLKYRGSSNQTIYKIKGGNVI